MLLAHLILQVSDSVVHPDVGVVQGGLEQLVDGQMAMGVATDED